jgi:DNA-binding response OmpR family regulator
MEGTRILVVEDEYLLAEDLRRTLQEQGAIVVGPAPSIPAAERLLADEAAIDFAVLDINLAGTSAYPIADRLVRSRIPFAFVSGFERSTVPPRFAGIAVLEKPLNFRLLCDAISAGVRSHHDS